MFLISLTIILVVTAISYLVIAKPIINIQGQLHRIKPGTKTRIETPQFHKLSELGTLTADTNMLLDRAERQIDNEISLRKEVENLEQQFRMIFESSSAATALTDEKNTILLSNPAFETLLEASGITRKNSYGPFMRELFSQADTFEKEIRNAIINKEPFTGEFKLASTNKEAETWVRLFCSINTDESYRNFYQFSMHNITSSRLRIKELNKLANFDQLTGLENRQSAETRIQRLIDQREKFALILLDLNGFKPINDVYGHDSGDKILQHIANNLKKSMRKNDVCCRWGGDEFVLAFSHSDKQDITKIASNLIRQIEKPLHLNDHDVSVSVGASMGCVIYQQDNTNLNTIIKLADEAMYSVKTDSDHYIRFADEI